MLLNNRVLFFGILVRAIIKLLPFNSLLSQPTGLADGLGLRDVLLDNRKQSEISP
jgi:hypothetical protein